MRNSPVGDALFMFKIIAMLLIAAQAVFGQPQKPEIVAEPIPLFEQSLERDYLAPVSGYAAGHRGIDFTVELDSELLSPINGIITFADKLVDRNVVTVTSDTGKKFSFEPACAIAGLGTKVSMGQVVARHCSPDSNYKYHCESCVHFSVRSQFGYLSPLYMLAKLTPSRLTA